ncbi:MAG: GMC family oxidoreductase [Pseudomonadota bacterium]
MLYDAMIAPPPEMSAGYDVCILGAGAAGVPLALKLADAGKRVVLLEGGGLETENRSQDLYYGDAELGYPYSPLEACRLRQLGGSTQHWGGRCAMLDPHDFEPRPDLGPEYDHRGWPIRIDALAPYAAPACAVLGLAEFDAPRRAIPGTETMERVLYRWSGAEPFAGVIDAQPVRMRERYSADLEAASHIDLILNANALGFALDPDQGRILGVRFQSYDGPVRSVAAARYVLALGGIENSRFLLNENAKHQNRLGNTSDMVGRCFGEHPHVRVGTYFVSKRPISWLPDVAEQVDTVLHRHKSEMIVGPTAAFMRANGVMNCGLRVQRLRNQALSEELAAASPLTKGLIFGEDYHYTGFLMAASEMAPDPNSRVRLIDEVDRFGLRRAGVDLKINPIEIKTKQLAAFEVAKMFIRTGIGRVWLEPWVLSGETPDLSFGNHHLGGCRMSETVETGVVDADCRVHGLENLYVAGSGVFSTGGAANPTFTVVQLALRLADHLCAR